MDIIEDLQRDEFIDQIPLNREFNELEKYCDPCSFKDGCHSISIDPNSLISCVMKFSIVF